MASEKMTEYERKRFENIRRNDQMMAALKIHSAAFKRQSDEENTEDSNRGMLERVWNEDDEIALLKGAIQFEEERVVKVTKDMPGFFDFIKDSLQCKVKLPQVAGKINGLKRKFLNNNWKRRVEPKFANSYDQDCFDLSKRIWGRDGASTSAGGLGESSGVKSRAQSSRVESRAAKKNSSITDVGGDNKQGNGQNGKQGNGQVEVERPLRVVGNVQEAASDQADSLRRHFLRSCMGAANMEEMVNSGLKMLQGEKKAELEDRWMKFHVEGLERYLKHLDLLKEQSLLILAELKSSLVGNGQAEVERPLRVVGNVQEAASDQADSLRRHFLRSCMGAANMEEMVNSGLKMLQGEKKAELEDRWMKFHVEGLERYLKHLDLLKEQSLLILAELKSSLVGKL